jgi:exodeoxyribonuclease VII small subunit
MLRHHGTQNQPQRDPYGCDVSHDLIMFLLATAGPSRFTLPAAPSSSFDPAERHVYRSAMPTQKAAKDAAPDFELAMRDLEELVERLEQGDLPLEESLAAFERGVMLTRTCQTALKEAEQKVEILLKKAGEPAVEEFSPEETKAG